MTNILGGLGYEVKDWVESRHQVGNRYQSHLGTMQDRTWHAKAYAKMVHRDTNLEVMAQIITVQNASYCKFVVDNNNTTKILKKMVSANECRKNRMEASQNFKDVEAWTLYAILTAVES
jgi:hypothetical protein